MKQKDDIIGRSIEEVGVSTTLKYLAILSENLIRYGFAVKCPNCGSYSLRKEKHRS